MKQSLNLRASRFELTIAHLLIALGERAGRWIVRLGERAEAAAERKALARGVSVEELVGPLLERGYWRPI